LTPDHCN